MPPTFQFEKFFPELRAGISVNAVGDRVLVCKGLIARIHNGSAVQKCHITVAVMKKNKNKKANKLRIGSVRRQILNVITRNENGQVRLSRLPEYLLMQFTKNSLLWFLLREKYRLGDFVTHMATWQILRKLRKFSGGEITQ